MYEPITPKPKSTVLKIMSIVPMIVILIGIVILGIIFVPKFMENAALNNSYYDEIYNGYEDYDIPDIDNYNQNSWDEPVNPRIPDDLPDCDFGRYEFTIIFASGRYNDSYWDMRDIVADEETGDIINDAVYRRNRTVEEKYNIKIRGVYSDDPYRNINNNVKAGINEFDLVALPMQNLTAQLLQEGYLVDLYNIPYIDFSKPWWDKNAIQQLSFGHKLYFTPNALLTSDKDALSVFLFNKERTMIYGLEDPYQLVMNGLWTIDKMREMAISASNDLNGDGIMDENDSFGLLVDGYKLYDNILGSGHYMAAKDANDFPVNNIQDPVIHTSFDKWINIYNNNERYTTFIQPDTERRMDMFATGTPLEGRALFMYESMFYIPTLRSLETDFGILPNPKLDTAQEKYYTPVNTQHASAISIPVTNGDLERTGIILEALTAESYYTLLPAYYNAMLSGRYYWDDQSGDMLDILLNYKCYDLADVYGWGYEIKNRLLNMPFDNDNDFVSVCEKYSQKMNAAMTKAIDMFKELY